VTAEKTKPFEATMMEKKAQLQAVWGSVDFWICIRRRRLTIRMRERWKL
jgi:hypothetical protein